MNTLVNNPYYKEMLKRNRLLPIFVDDKMKCFITYFIGNGDVSKYTQKDSWSVVDDEPKTGDTAYIDQLISDHEKNHKYSKMVWNILINHIKENYPQVKQLRWNRLKNGEVKTYKKEIVKENKNFDFCKNECRAYCCNIITVILKNNRTPQEENEVQLILAHAGTQLGEKDGVQYIEIETKCKFLTNDNACSIYDKRFDTCRKYECEKLKEM